MTTVWKLGAGNQLKPIWVTDLLCCCCLLEHVYYNNITEWAVLLYCSSNQSRLQEVLLNLQSFPLVSALPLTKCSSPFHVAYQVLHVLGNGFGVEQSGVHPSFAVLEDHIHFLNSACTSTHQHKSLRRKHTVDTTEQNEFALCAWRRFILGAIFSVAAAICGGQCCNVFLS